MDDWGIIECGFNTADETLNFGTRNLARGDNLYEACTLASLRCSQPESSTVNLRATTKAGKVFLSIDRTMKAFANALCNELSLSLSFEEAIDAFCVTDDGKLLVICLRDGLVHCIDTADENKVVFSTSVVVGDGVNVTFVDCFVESYRDGSMCVLAAACDGRVFRVSFEFADAGEVVSDLIVDFDCLVKSVSFNGSVILADGEKLCVYDVPNRNLEFCDGLSLKQIYPYGNSLFICIDEHGHLIQVCASTLLHVTVNDEVNFESFVFVGNPSSASQILTFTKPPDSVQSNVQALTYPGLAPLFSLKTGEAVRLVRPENVHDEYMYVVLLKSPGGFTEELRILQVVDTDPENCLRRMLRRGKFEGAFEFARAFKLDALEIWKAKAESIVEKLVCSGDDVRELLAILGGVENEVAFKIRCCLAVFKYCEDLDDVRAVLNYGCRCLSDCSEAAEDAEEVQALVEMVSEVMNRFETFVLIRKQGEYDVDWGEFSECDLFDLVREALQECNVERAAILYSRMDLTYLSEVDERQVQAILSLLNNLSLDACVSFLFSFLPVTLTHAPATLPLFVSWMQQKVFSIESGCAGGFPQNAMDFLDVFLQILNLDNLGNRGEPDSLTRGTVEGLTLTMRTLKTLKFLKETYGIAIPLKEYTKSPRSLISTLLFARLDEEFLRGFILENHLEPDEVFLEEIRGLVKHQEWSWIKVVPSILRCINSIEVRLNAVVEVLENADVPWCRAVREIAGNSLRYKHGLVTVIREKIKNEPNQVVLRNPKYGFPRDVSISNDLPFIIGRIIYCDEPTLMDDAFQLCADSEQTTWITSRLTDCFVRSGNIASVKAVLNRLKPDELDDLCASLIDLIECYDNLKPELPRNVVQNYPLVLRLLRNGRRAEAVETCRNFLKLKEDFRPDVRLGQLRNPRERRGLLDLILSDVALELTQGTLSVGESVKRCAQISALLGEAEADVMVEFCRKLDGFDSIVEFVEAMCLDESGPENLCLMAVLIMKSVFCREDGGGGGALIKIDTYSLGLDLAQKLSVLAMLRSKPSDIGACVPVYDWVMSTFFSRNKFNADLVERCPPKSSGFGTFQSFQFIFNAFAQLAVGYKNPDLKYLTHFENRVSHLSEEQFVKTVERLPSLVNNLCLEGHGLTASKLVVTLKNALLNFGGGASPELREALQDVLVNRCAPQVLQKLFSARNIDSECAYILLINSKRKDAVKEIRNYLQVNRRNVQKLAALAKLALRVMKHQRTATAAAAGNGYVEIVLLSKWWQRIGESQLSLKEFFTTTPRSELLAKLLQHRHLNLEMLTEFCADFDLDSQTSYVAYLKAMLTKWTPDYVTIKDEFGETKITVENDEEQLFKACGEVVELIDDKESVGAAVNNFYHSINFYHYEVFMCVFKIWRMLKKKNVDSAKETMLLSFLRTYTRVKVPNTPEIEEWFSTFPNSQSIDPLSRWRLPFTRTLFTKDIWKIIRPELNLKTYTIWFDVVRILDETLNKDDICIYAVKEVVSSGTLKEKAPDSNLFEEIDACVQNIANCEKATSVVYHLLTQTPEGADQVIAAELCLKYAGLYKERCSESDPSVLDAFEKVTCKYLYITGSHILRKYRLADDEYVKMLPHSHDLIGALYMDRRILRKAYDCPDINKAVDELGALFKMDVQERRAQLLEGYLSELNTSRVSMSDSSFWSIKSLEINEGACEFNTEHNRKRALYICQGGELTHWQNFLLEKGFCGRKSLSFRVNALKCLCAISNPESVETLTNSPYSAVVDHIEKLSILSDLQSLGYLIDVEQLDKQKMVLLKRLSQDLDNPLSIKAMTSICIKYEVDELEFWEKIVGASVKHLLHQNLKNCLNFLKTISNVRHRKIYTDAWQAVIDHSFAANKEDAYNTCIENILLLQSCPVLFALDLKKAFKSCCKLQLLEFAAVILQYLQEADQLECAKEILRSNRESLLTDVEKLSLRGIWGTSWVLNLLRSVVDSSRIE